MSVNEQTKRVLSFLLSVILLLQYVPAPALAEEIPQTGLCEHHVAHEDCGYVAAVAGVDCNHEHDDNCNTVECTHNHDENCGYADAVEGRECDFVCEACAAEEADAAAVAEVKALMDALPALDAVKEMPIEDQKTAYEQTQSAYEAYEKLTVEQQALLEEPEEVFKPLFDYFNTLIDANGEIGSGTPDGTPPVLKNLTITATSMTASGSIEVIADAEDDISGITSFDVWFDCIELGESLYAYLSPTYYDEDLHQKVPYADGMFHGFIKADQYQESGVFVLNRINISDAAGNAMHYRANVGSTDDNFAVFPAELKDIQFMVHNSDADVITSVGNSDFTEAVENAEHDSYIIADYSGDTTMPKEAFEAISGTDKTIDLISEGITWRFEGSDITEEVKDIDLNVEIQKVEGDSSVSGEAIEDSLNGNPGVVMKFPENGTLPGKATIQVKVDYAMREYLGSDQGLCVYYYNNQTGELELVAENLTVINDTYVEFEITHCSYYVLTATGNTSANGSQSCGDNLTWSVDEKTGTLTISGSGDMYHYDPNGGPWGDEIVAVVVEEGVTSIGDYAFFFTPSLQTVIIADSVLSIGEMAFANCRSLSSADLPGNLTAIGWKAFWDTNIRDVHIPATVTQIGEGAFAGNHASKNITVAAGNTSYLAEDGILFTADKDALLYYPPAKTNSQYIVPDSVKRIGERAFSGNESLTSVVLPEGTTEIGYLGFEYCSNLASVTLPSTLTDIGSCAFIFTGLQEITIPENVEKIGAIAFYGCTLLRELTFQGDAPSFEQSASIVEDMFTNVEATAYYPANNPTWTSDVMQDYGGNLTWIGYEDSVFSGVCGDDLIWNFDEETGALTISGSGAMYHYRYEDIPWGQFREQILSVSISEGATNVGEFAFRNCPNLNQIALPQTVTEIAYRAFSDCSSLKEVEVPNSVTTISYNAFTNCTDLMEITIPENVTAIESEVFRNCSSLKTVALPASVTEIAYAAFADCSSLTKVTIPGAVMEISYFAFNNCTSLKAITLPESVESIHESAFENCTGLTKVNIPDRVHTIKEAAFRNCSSLTEVTLPENITEITYLAFADCSSLTKVAIPSSVSEIAYFAFDNCTGLQQVTLPQNVTNVVYDAFSDCTGLTTVVAPVNLNSISDGAFRGCDNLTTVILPENLQTVGTKAFAPFYNVRTMHFTGDAPAFASDAFLGVAATAQYPLSKSTWTASVRQNYGGEILWQSYGDPPADRLPIEEGEVLEQPTVWVDGVEYPIQTDGDSSYIDLPDNASNMVVHGYHGGDPTDVHTQYPTSMQVWVLHKKENGSYRMEHIEEMDDILQYSGMSIRVTGKKGIRMITSVDTNKKTSLTGTGLAEYKLLEYGTVVAWARNLTDGKSLTLGQPHTISNYAYKKGVADPVFNYAGNLMQYTNVLVGFSADQMKDDLAMRPYMVVESPEGEKMTIYGGIVYRNIGYIAWQNRNVFEPGSESYDYVWDIIHHVYGEQYDEEYKG